MTELNDDTAVGYSERGYTGDGDVLLSDLAPEIQALIRAGLAAPALAKALEAERNSTRGLSDEALGALAAYQAAIGGTE